MAQVAEGPGWHSGSLPVRAHDLLLSFAGQVDDDALADARELLASAEVDRTLDFLVGCLVAGHIPVSAAQRGELDALSAPAYLDRSLVDRLTVDDAAVAMRHRFGAEVPSGETAAQGVAEAAHRVLDALPDVRSVWAVWRLTPAGAVSGPVPHRVVLVGVGPGGFPTATAYRLEHTLRRVGVRASVEALRDGAQAPDYHHAAMQHATQVPFSAHAAIAPARPAAAQLSASRLPPVPSDPARRIGPPSATRMPAAAVNPASAPRLEPSSGSRLPAPVNPPPRLEPPTGSRIPPGPPSRTRMPAAGSPSVPRLEPPSLSSTPPAQAGPPSMSRMPPSRPGIPPALPPDPGRTGPVPPIANRVPPRPPGPPSMTRMPAAGSPSVPRLEPPSLSGTRPAAPGPPSMSRMPPSLPPPPGPPSMSRMPPAPPRGRPGVPADPLASAAPRPPAPPRRAEPYPAPPRAGTASGLPPLPADAALSEQEKYLLRQLQEELVRREREEATTALPPGGPTDPRWSNSGGQTMVNGIPPQYPDYRR